MSGNFLRKGVNLFQRESKSSWDELVARPVDEVIGQEICGVTGEVEEGLRGEVWLGEAGVDGLETLGIDWDVGQVWERPLSELCHAEVVGVEQLVEVGQSPWGDVAGGTDGVADIQGEVEPLCHIGHSKYDHLRPGCSRVTLRAAYIGG